MFADYRRNHFHALQALHKERRARQLAVRQTALPLTADERRVIDQLNDWIDCGSSLWTATSMVFKSESDFYRSADFHAGRSLLG